MWVWIPRYVYKISSGWHGEGLAAGQAGTIDVQFSKGVDDSWNGAVDLRETAYASKATGENNNGDKYTNHPAFTFGDTELTGFWMAKFEASSSDPNLEHGGGNVTNLKVKSVPNTISWRYITWNNAWTVMRNMETDNFYGWGSDSKDIDTHMFKNVEWGAVAYLAQSIYGKNSEVWFNPSHYMGRIITGRSGNAAILEDLLIDFPNQATSNLYGYDGRTCSSKTGYVCTGAVHATHGRTASTTGNIYGVYDMSGGGVEYAAAYTENAVLTMGAVGSLILNAPPKYKDVYFVGNPENSINNYDKALSHKGDAIYETSSADAGENSWYGNKSLMLYGNNSGFQRGGSNWDTPGAGIFALDRLNNDLYRDIFGFRPVLVVNNGL